MQKHEHNFRHNALFFRDDAQRHNARIFEHDIPDPREYEQTIRRNPATFLAVLRWEGYIPHMTFARGLPTCQSMLRVKSFKVLALRQ